MAARGTPFGEQVRSLRSSVGLTQGELAEAAGISERTVSDIERGLRSSVYPGTARRLAGALNVAEDRLPAFLLGAVRASDGKASANVGTVPSSFRSRLPSSPTRLIGRDAEVASTAELVRDPRIRLVTLVGPGGVGKSRLAIEVAATVKDGSAGAVYFVSLSTLDDPARVLAEVAASVGITPGTGDLIETLSRRLDSGVSLLILDTFEHLLPAATDVSALIAACSQVTVLATSRSPLKVRGERQVAVHPLALDSPDGTAMSPAVELFWERAQAVAPDLSPEPATLDTVADICARTDGLPLAIELAAASTKHMPLAELRTNLEHRLDPLVGGARDAPARHRTMRAALDWSYALLGGAEMRLFRCLPVFRGSFGSEAVEAIVTTGVADVRATLNALVDCSLVIVETGSSSRARYRLLDLVREYALERAEAAGDLDAVRERHAGYFLALGERAEPELRGSDQWEWRARLLEDEDNFRAALGWALESGEPDMALRLAGALWMFWRWAGMFTEARAWLEEALASAKDSAPAVRLQALWGAGWLAYHQDDHRRTVTAGREMLAILDDQDDPLRRRNALTLIGNVALAEQRYPEAIDALREALRSCGPEEGTWHLASSRLNLGTAYLAAGRIADARAHLTSALSAYQELGDQHFVARALIQLGYAALAEGDRRLAGTHIADATSISEQLGDAWSIADALEAVAVLRADDAPETTAMLAGTALRLRDQIAMHPHPADAVVLRRRIEEATRGAGAEDFGRAWAKGRASPLGPIVALAAGAAREIGDAVPGDGRGPRLGER